MGRACWPKHQQPSKMKLFMLLALLLARLTAKKTALAMVAWAWTGLAPAWEAPAWEDLAWEGQDLAWVAALVTVWVVDLATAWEDLDMVWVAPDMVGQDMMAWALVWAWALDTVETGMLENAALQRRSGEACTRKRMGSTTWSWNGQWNG